MGIKSSKILVDKALTEIKTLEPSEVKEIKNKDQCTLIDIRDIRELWREGTIKDSIHIPRGMLEFWLDPKSPYSKDIDNSKEIVLFCAGGLRSALAAKSLNEMGFEKVSHIDGGFAAMKKNGFEIV